VEEGARGLPVALQRPLGPTRHLRDLLEGQPREEPPLDELRELAVGLPELSERLVERDDLGGALLHRYLDVLEIQGPPPRASALAGPPAGLVDEDHAHRPRRDREEVRAVLRGPAGAPRQLQIGLVDERRRRERLLAWRAAQLAVRDGAQLVVKH